MTDRENDIGRFRRLNDLLDAALDLREPERADFVENVCGDDIALRRELRRLLGLVESSEEFLESPASDIAASLLRERPAD